MDSIVWGRGYDTFARPIEEVARDADAVLLVENYDAGWVPDLGRLRALRVFWSIDSHVALAAHVRMCRRQRIHLLLNATEGYLPRFRAAGRRTSIRSAWPASLGSSPSSRTSTT